eukprot:GHVQ01020680.1.p1 GENE.GHVQ01020680.1~~GHVQ01020680.1.p1  ORF type:complete len:303 (+),score=79.33 GHVQ01020680.1:577-1485(+)
MLCATMEEFAARLDKEHARVKRRNMENDQRRREQQAEQQKAEEERRRATELQRAADEKQEIRRREEAQKRREEKRAREEKYRVKAETANEMLEEIRKLGSGTKVTIKGKLLEEINVDDVLEGTVIFEDIEKAQDEQRNKERIERVRQRRGEAKRMDHFVRACREEEIPLLESWKSKIQEADTAVLLELQSKHEEEHKAAFEEALNEKQMFEYVVPYKEEFIAERMSARRVEYETARAEQTARLTDVLKTQKTLRAKERRNNEIERQKQEQLLKELQENERRALENLESQNKQTVNGHAPTDD